LFTKYMQEGDCDILFCEEAQATDNYCTVDGLKWVVREVHFGFCGACGHLIGAEEMTDSSCWTPYNFDADGQNCVDFYRNLRFNDEGKILLPLEIAEGVVEEWLEFLDRYETDSHWRDLSFGRARMMPTILEEEESGKEEESNEEEEGDNEGEEDDNTYDLRRSPHPEPPNI
jgi:hypothetical protein